MKCGDLIGRTNRRFDSIGVVLSAIFDEVWIIILWNNGIIRPVHYLTLEVLNEGTIKD